MSADPRPTLQWIIDHQEELAAKFEQTDDDPRTDAVSKALWPYVFAAWEVPVLLNAADAADRAAGVIRVRVDDATVEKVARQLHQQDAYEIHNDWDDLSDYRRDAFRDRARGILEALVTP